MTKPPAYPIVANPNRHAHSRRCQIPYATPSRHSPPTSAKASRLPSVSVHPPMQPRGARTLPIPRSPIIAASALIVESNPEFSYEPVPIPSRRRKKEAPTNANRKAAAQYRTGASHKSCSALDPDECHVQVTKELYPP